MTMPSHSASPLATLEPVRFGEFLRDRHLITDEQWLAALAQHWSEPLVGRRKRIGATIVENGFLSAEVVEREARIFHDDLDVVEVTDDPQVPDLTRLAELADRAEHIDRIDRSEKPTLPVPTVHLAIRA
jgi:hypothetical protein